MKRWLIPKLRATDKRSDKLRRDSFEVDAVCVIRRMPITDSGACRSPIPAHADRRFRPCRSPETLA